MEKIGAVAIGASKAAGEEPHIPVPASVVASDEEAPAGLGQIPLGWDPYEEVVYIRPENPYDTSIADPWSEVTRVFSPSLVLPPFPSLDARSYVIRARLFVFLQ
ncbi:MAG: hypothetical protein Q4P90_08710 [Bifidobacteriaceae bacterium]|nr:hypothetical protein [Bifidobacteriaceae bacterium]